MAKSKSAATSNPGGGGGGIPTTGPVVVKWVKVTNVTVNTNTKKRAFFRADSGMTAHYGYVEMDSNQSRDWVKKLIEKMYDETDAYYDENAGNDIDLQYSDSYAQGGLSTVEAPINPNTHILASNVRDRP